MYESGTSAAGRSDLTSEPRVAFLGVGKAHGESLLSTSSANKLLPGFAARLGSSSKSEDEVLGFVLEGSSSSPNKDIATERVAEYRQQKGKLQDGSSLTACSKNGMGRGTR